MPRAAILLLLTAGACKPQDYLEGCPPARIPTDPVELATPPFLQIYRDRVRLVWQTLQTTPLSVQVDRGDRCAEVLLPTEVGADLSWTWPAPEDAASVERPDTAGSWLRYEVDLVLGPGEEVTWSLPLGDGAEITGTAHLPAAQGDPVRAVFVADTTLPDSDQVWEAIARVEPDLVLHGGDLQHRSDPSDTWREAFWRLRDVGRTAWLHVAPGDRDRELDELDEHYVRLFGRQGRPGGSDTWHALDAGGTRFILLDGAAGLDRTTSPQLAWLADELDDVATDATLDRAVVVVHDAPYTLTPAGPAFDSRAPLAEVFADTVPVVLSGSGLAYERFDIDGVAYVVDGGGGSPLEDPDALLSSNPDDAARRVAASATHGFTVLDIDAFGALTVSRRTVDGAEIDAFGPLDPQDR